MKLYKHFVLFNTSKWLDGTGSYFINFSMHLNHLKGLNFWFTDSKMKLEISSWLCCQSRDMPSISPSILITESLRDESLTSYFLKSFLVFPLSRQSWKPPTKAILVNEREMFYLANSNNGSSFGLKVVFTIKMIYLLHRGVVSKRQL